MNHPIEELEKIYKQANIDYQNDLVFKALSKRCTRLLHGVQTKITVEQHNQLAEQFFNRMGSEKCISEKIFKAFSTWIILDLLTKETDVNKKLPEKDISFAMEFRYIIQQEIEEELLKH